MNRDPWGRPYKTVMKRLKSLPMLAPTCPNLLRRIVTSLFPKQRDSVYQVEYAVEEEVIPLITAEELMNACNRVGTSKAPGPDGIPNIALKTAIKARPDIFIEMYNACITEGVFPGPWKKQRLVLLPKGKRPPDDPSSYRPLCMLDTIGKILERIVYNRLEQVMGDRLAENQFGFRKGRSTLDAVGLVVNIAKKAISGKRWKRGAKKYCLISTLDIKNAFNSARWDCKQKALGNLKVPLYLRRMVANYLSERTLWYRTEDGLAEYNITGGVPQGSVLGPLLWNTMYDGLLRLALPENVQLIAFADDVAIVIAMKYLEEISNAFSRTIEAIYRWMNTVGLSLAEQKTEAVLITGRKKG